MDNNYCASYSIFSIEILLLAPVIEYRFDYPVHSYLKSGSDTNKLYLHLALFLT